MKQEVYTKFAEALQRKQAEQAATTRHQEVVAKFAEALDRQMAQKQAEAIYCEGFRKAAELMGVDPNALVKQALSLGDITAVGKSVVGGAKRVGQLLAGGDASKLKALTKMQQRSNEFGKRLGSTMDMIEAHVKASPAYKRAPLWQKMLGGGLMKTQKGLNKAITGVRTHWGIPLAYARGAVGGRGAAAATDEIRKVLAARLGAGAAATGAAGAGIAAATDGDQK